MTKEELIKEIKKLKYHNDSKKSWIDRELVLELVKQLDEPQKPVVPQFVVDWIERSKQEKRNIRNALNNGGEKMRLWFLDLENYDTFVRAWLDGCEVEQEKRYRVRIKGVYHNSCLIFDKINKKWFLSSIFEIDHQMGSHTRKELEDAGFGWVFDCPGIEIEEVEK